MNVEAISSSGAMQTNSMVSGQIDLQRKNKEKVADTPQATPEEKQVQPEELLNQIKAVTEDGTYSVRFERDDNSELIVKIFDAKTEEVVRQIPSDEILQLRETLADLRGNIVNTQI
ncbi:MAG TPA: flagellar biosynthesis protein FlaG [Desulfobacterales bacterium]|nr:flagellar biosynthesis protein FlaG [Desulfobacterales bacterium]